MQQYSSKPRAIADEPNTADRVYVDDRELARRTPLARATWQKMRIEGKGPAVRKIGRRCVYLWSEVVEFLESHRSATSSMADESAAP
jgi:predicted DNA-binding transcriptional regulator AlpA